MLLLEDLKNLNKLKFEFGFIAEYSNLTNEQIEKLKIPFGNHLEDYNIIKNNIYECKEWMRLHPEVLSIYNYNTLNDAFFLYNLYSAFRTSVTFKIDSKILKILWNTDCDIEKFHLPFSSVFIDSEIKLEDNFYIKGILLWDSLNKDNERKGTDLYLQHYNMGTFSNPEILEDNGNYIVVLLENTLNHKKFLLPLGTDGYYLKDNNISIDKDDIFAKYIYNNVFRKQLISFTISFLKFLYYPEVELVKKEYTEIRRIRKLQKGTPVENHYYLKINGKLKKYINDFDNNSNEVYLKHTLTWIVKGYYRKFVSNHWVNKKGQELFILPYIKGVGKLINKEYIISDKQVWYNQMLMQSILKNEIFPNHIILNNTRMILDGLELDAYIPDLKLAFEYDGKQHFDIVEKFNMDEDSLKNQIKRDKEKSSLCKQLGIKLIRIKYDETISKELILNKIKTL